MGEALGEVVMLTIVLIASAIPGGVLAWILIQLGIHPVINIGLPLISIWFLFPIMLLSVLDNGAMTQPLSSEVVSSIKERSDAWGAMYLWNALATLVLFGILYVALGSNLAIMIIGGTMIPFVIYFIFRQIGNLAVGIADLTNMNFDDDDESDAEESAGSRTEIL